MNKEFSSFAARLLPLLRDTARQSRTLQDDEFNQLALDLFALQFKHNAAYRKICETRGHTPGIVEHWTQIPAVPTAAFKELELTCLAPQERTTVFHSSGTTEQKPSRHYHCAESLKVYEASLWPWFEHNVFANSKLVVLTPPPEQAPHSSLIHMFETVRSRACQSANRSFFGTVAADGSWALDFDAILAALDGDSKLKTQNPKLILGTAFSFVHLLDYLAENNLRVQLPEGSRIMETGGYKNRSRVMPKEELHTLITERLGVPGENIVCEYGMSELSSQAYDGRATLPRGQDSGRAAARPCRALRFPSWARVQIISPETRCEVADGETGLIRVLDLANVFSVMAVQTEDLGVRRGDGFELIGRAQFAEPRGCSLMTA